MSLIDTTVEPRVFRTLRSDMSMLPDMRWSDAVDEIARRLMEQEEKFDREETRGHVETYLKRNGRVETGGVIYEVAQRQRKVVYR